MNTYTNEFKKNIVNLYQAGKTPHFLAEEYNIDRQLVHVWNRKFNNKENINDDNPKESDKEIIIIKEKRIKELEEQIYILKQAALILGKK